MEKHAIKSIKWLSQKEIENLIAEMRNEGWEVNKIVGSDMYFKKQVKEEIGYKQAYED